MQSAALARWDHVSWFGIHSSAEYSILRSCHQPIQKWQLTISLPMHCKPDVVIHTVDTPKQTMRFLLFDNEEHVMNIPSPYLRSDLIL